jgi:glycopeptide antibiotics resistance protein
MPTALRKTFVLVPVLLLGAFYLYDHSGWYARASQKRLLFLGLSVSFLYGWMLVEVLVRKQRSFLDIAVQSSFFVYLFMVLTLTGYFILFREVAYEDWWQKMLVRIDRKDHVNMKLFQIFKIYKNTHTQILGNLVLLFPLAIYIPLMYKKLSNVFVVVLICFLVSLMIEVIQLATKFRSADVDDVLLNTAGAAVGAFIFWFTKLVFSSLPPSNSMVTSG